jgi:hypothetical protein
MRKRKEIENCGEVVNHLILEVLLDIRDLIKKETKRKKGVRNEQVRTRKVSK